MWRRGALALLVVALLATGCGTDDDQPARSGDAAVSGPQAYTGSDDGFYDVQQKGTQPEGNLRGKFVSDAQGRFWFRTVKPRFYPIPDDGPVGKLLARLGRHPNRAAHIHFIIKAPGFETVITHIFSPDCQYLDQDTVFGVKASLIGKFDRVDDADQARAQQTTNPFWLVEQTFVLSKAR